MNNESTGEENADLPVHAVLGGKYELIDVLGTGATFTVYEAQRVATAIPHPPVDGISDQHLVVKVLHPHLVDDHNARESLRREVEASALVTHPAVVKVLDSGEEDVAGASVPWIVMNRVAGISLSDFSGNHGLPWRDALMIIDGLLLALEAVHGAGLVHRDVSPRNVMIDLQPGGSYAVGLLDLGLTQPEGGEGDGDMVAGSVMGMSPEQARGKPLDARSDIYAVGALAYYILTGHAPYERARAEDVLRAHVNAPVPAASARRAAVPASVDRLVARAMAKDPGRRFATAEAMRGTVAVLLDGPAGRMGNSDETVGVGAGGTEVIGSVAGAGTMKLGQAADGIGRTTMIGAVGPASGEVKTASTAGPPFEDLPEENRSWWQSMTGRGRAIMIAVIALVVFGGVGLVVANVLGDGGVPVVTPSMSPDPLEPTPTFSSSPTPSEDEEDEVLPAPIPTPTPTASPSQTPTLSPSPSPTSISSPPPTPDPSPTTLPDPTPTTTEGPTSEPTTEPTAEPTSEPSAEPTAEPTSEPTSEPTDEPTGGGETDAGAASGGEGEAAGQPTTLSADSGG